MFPSPKKGGNFHPMTYQEILKKYWENAAKGGRKSIPYDAFDKKYSIRQNGSLLHYLEAVSLYLEEIEKQGSE